MRFTYICGEAIDSLKANFRRASLAALGLLVGVAAVLCVISAGEGLKSLIIKEMGSYGRPTHLHIYPNYRYLSSIGWSKQPEYLSDRDIEDLREMKELLAGLSPYTEAQFTIRYGARDSVSRIVCVASDYFPMEHLELDSGRMFNAEDDYHKRRAAIVGAGLAEKLFGVPGSYDAEDPIGKLVAVGTFGEVEIIGVLKREPPSLFQAIQSYDTTNNGAIFVPYSAARRFTGLVRPDTIMAAAVSESKVDAATQAITNFLNDRHGTWDGNPKFLIESGKSALQEVNVMTTLVTSFISAVAGLSLIVAGIGVMNVMLISVKERTREIGTRKALGARGSWIGRQFLIESLSVCLGGGIAGVLLAYFTALAVSRYSMLPALLPSGALPLALLLSVLTALAFGWLPARRASKMDPCEALRYE